MSSEFDIHAAFIQDISKQATLDSQRLSNQIKQLRQQMQQLQKNIENKNDNLNRQITPRIQQLQQKIECYWNSIEVMDKVAWQQLQQQRAIFVECSKIVKEMQERIEEIGHKV